MRKALGAEGWGHVSSYSEKEGHKTPGVLI